MPLKLWMIPDGRSEAARRAERIEAVSVNRSGITAIYGMDPWPNWSPEAQNREPRLAAARHRLTAGDRIEAWRELFKLTGEWRIPLVWL